MNNHKRQFAPEGDTGAGAGKSEHPAQDLAQEAAKKRVGDPGSIEHAAGMHQHPKADEGALKSPIPENSDNSSGPENPKLKP